MLRFAPPGISAGHTGTTLVAAHRDPHRESPQSRCSRSYWSTGRSAQNWAYGTGMEGGMLELAASEHADFMKFPACRGASTPDMPASRVGRGLVKTWMCVCCRNSYSKRTSTQLPRSVNLFVSRQSVRPFHEISPNTPRSLGAWHLWTMGLTRRARRTARR